MQDITIRVKPGERRSAAPGLEEVSVGFLVNAAAPV